MKRISWFWALPAVGGLALIMVAALLSSSSPSSPGVPAAQAQLETPTPTATFTPTATATVNPACQLHVNKTVGASTVPENGTATFTIEITNDGNGDCVDPLITDVIPDKTDCDAASVASTSDVTDINISGCKSSGTVKWDSDDNFGHNDTVVLTLVLALESGAHEGAHITNEACATSSSDVGGDCDSARITVGAPATATPTTAPTVAPVPTVPTIPPVPTVIVPVPTARALPTLTAPVTGTGTSSGGSGPLALGLGLAGGVMLLVSGAALVKRAR